MAANIYFVMSRCQSDLMVEAFVNDEPTIIPGCGELKCPFEVIELLWGPIADDCDMEEICRVDQYYSSAAAVLPSMLTFLIVFSFIYLFN